MGVLPSRVNDLCGVLEILLLAYTVAFGRSLGSLVIHVGSL